MRMYSINVISDGIHLIIVNIYFSHFCTFYLLINHRYRWLILHHIHLKKPRSHAIQNENVTNDASQIWTFELLGHGSVTMLFYLHITSQCVHVLSLTELEQSVLVSIKVQCLLTSETGKIIPLTSHELDHDTVPTVTGRNSNHEDLSVWFDIFSPCKVWAH